MRKYAKGFGRKIAKVQRSSENICTPLGGKAIAKICTIRVPSVSQTSLYSDFTTDECPHPHFTFSFCGSSLLRINQGHHSLRTRPWYTPPAAVKKPFSIFSSRRLAATATFIHRYGISIHRRCCPIRAALLETVLARLPPLPPC